MKLSICIPVYNQQDLLRKHLEEVIQYKGDDIEIVVSDNCSDDDIKGLVYSFSDDRIIYVKTEKHVTQALNAINSFSNATGDYIFFTRTKDILIPDKIPTVINIIQKHPNAVYFLFSAYDENMKIRMQLEDKVYSQYDEAQHAHELLLAHPGGQIYKKSNLLMDQYKVICASYKRDVQLASIIRMDLALKGDFVTSSEVVWVYFNTFVSDQTAAELTYNENTVDNPYSPKIQILHFECIWKYINEYVPTQYKDLYLKFYIKDYARVVTVHYYFMNKDKGCHKHYGCKQERFNPYKSLSKYKKYINNCLNEINRKDLQDYLDEVIKLQRSDITKTIFLDKKRQIKSIIKCLISFQ